MCIVACYRTRADIKRYNAINQLPLYLAAYHFANLSVLSPEVSTIRQSFLTSRVLLTGNCLH